jgi:hypothetical protein
MAVLISRQFLSSRVKGLLVSRLIGDALSGRFRRYKDARPLKWERRERNWRDKEKNEW